MTIIGDFEFLVEITTTESAKFPYKTDLSKVNNVKTNKTRSTKWAYRKERSFATNYLKFLKIKFQCKICKRFSVI